MPFNHCIAAALADGLITEDKAAHYSEIYEEELHARSGAMTPHEAAAEAARATFDAIDGDAAESRRRTVLSLGARESIAERLEGADAYTQARGLYDRLARGRDGLAVEQQHDFWRGQAFGELDNAWTTYRRNFFGQRRNAAGLVNIVREAFGQDTRDAAAAALVEGWRKASETLRQGFNRFGGHIGQLEDWGLPQNHNALTIRGAGLEPWKNFVMPLLDRTRMVDRDTGRPLNDAQLGDVLNKVYMSIVTGGWADREPTGAGGTALANRRDDSRVLHFKGADDWFSYQKRFGQGDPIDAMIHHVEAMSRDVAHMQVMGPNPASTLRWVQQTLEKKAALAGEPHKGRAANDALNAMYVNYTRSNAAPSHPIVADLVGDLHNVLSAAQLGSALWTVMPADMNMQRTARAFNGLPEAKMLWSYFKQLNPASAEHRMLAVKLGLGADMYARTLAQQGRYSVTIGGHQWSRFLNDRTLTASGLSPWMAAGHASFGTDFYGHVAGEAGKSFADLDPYLRESMERYGIGESEWNDIRTTPQLMRGSAGFIRPADIMARTDLDPSRSLELASKLADMVQSESARAVPSGMLAARAITRGLDRPGSARDVMAQSMAMYRNFASWILIAHGRRMMDLWQNGQYGRLGRYAGALIIGNTIAGALTLQARELMNGRDPRDMEDWRFWADAMMKGGGLGLLGDFAYASLFGENGAGQGLTTTLAGPIAGFAEDAAETLFTKQGIGAAARGPNSTAKNFATRTLEFTKRNFPGGNIWYARLAMERFVWDQLQSLTDPDWQMRVGHLEKWYRAQFGNSYWWHHGDLAPARAPDMSTSVPGGNQQ